MFTPANLFGSIFFGSVGLAAFVYGKKTGGFKAMLIGIALMVYPYFVSQPWLLYGIGAMFTASLFVFRD